MTYLLQIYMSSGQTIEIMCTKYNFESGHLGFFSYEVQGAKENFWVDINKIVAWVATPLEEEEE